LITAEEGESMINDTVETGQVFWSEVATDSPGSKMTFFDSNTMEPIVPTPEAFEGTVVPEKLRDKINLAELHGTRLTLKVLLNQSSDNGYSLVQVTAAPHTVMQRHKHNVDQIVWCVAGSMTQGNRLIEAGSGYFTPANQAYGYEAGPDGVTVLEFRASPLDKTETVFVEENPVRWGLEPDTASAE
jgi:quercetin dioxygenase-like cupin family protein